MSIAPDGTRMSYWIAKTLHRARTQAGIQERTMAELLDVDYRTIKRWEAGDSFGRKTELDRAVAGYAYVLGHEDGRELWREALEWWLEEGSPPEFVPGDGPAAAFAAALREAAIREASLRQREGQRPQRRTDVRRRAPSSTRKRRQAG